MRRSGPMNKTRDMMSNSIKKTKEILNVYKNKFFHKAKVVKKVVGTRLDEHNLSFLKEVNFNLHHFTTVVMVSLLAFFVTLYSTGFNTTRVDATSISGPSVQSYNEEALEVSFGDSDAIASIAKDILVKQVSSVVEPKKIASTGMESVYEVGNYVASVKMDASLGSGSATLTLETKKTYANKDAVKVVAPTYGEVDEIADGMQYTYNIKLHIEDTKAPKISMVSKDITIMETDDYDVHDFVKAVIDDVDGVLDYTVENDVPKDSDGTLKHGRHYVTIKAKDKSGNESEQTLIVRVYKKTNTSSSSSYDQYKNQGNYASNGAIGSAIANAALAQLGRYQDCTMLVTNSLRAVGINFHGWPYQYLSLGTIVPYSQAMPGDIVVYNGHVAIYIGNGMCVHGGWYGTQTVIYSIYCASGAFTIVRV